MNASPGDCSTAPRHFGNRVTARGTNKKALPESRSSRYCKVFVGGGFFSSVVAFDLSLQLQGYKWGAGVLEISGPPLLCGGGGPETRRTLVAAKKSL